MLRTFCVVHKEHQADAIWGSAGYPQGVILKELAQYILSDAVQKPMPFWYFAALPEKVSGLQHQNVTCTGHVNVTVVCASEGTQLMWRGCVETQIKALTKAGLDSIVLPKRPLDASADNMPNHWINVYEPVSPEAMNLTMRR